ncbi:MAG: aminopeptidase P family protein [Alphaproteobacteria bacterium]|nr:aminopeptidase P family protein [Alphaproteobacteria bacterium]MBQ9235289.1 aminopeptidase P family protein [Alphaproteobacteria bacterium]
MTTLAAIQTYLTEHQIDCYIVTRNNMFIGADVLPNENKIRELTGFTGSAGSLLVFADHAVLLVDGRYELQASLQVDTAQIKVVCTRDSLGSWIHHNLKQPTAFMYDAWCHSTAETDYWHRALEQHRFIEDNDHLLGERINHKESEIFELKEEFTGISSDEKIAEFAKFLQENKLDAYLLCECDSVSWLMNLRSDLIQYSPYLRAYALVDSDGGVSLFTADFSKLQTELSRYSGKLIGLNFARTPRRILACLKDNRIRFRNINNPIVDWKSIKNPIEIDGFRKCHLRDGVAVCEFWHWLVQNYTSVDEINCVERLHELRALQEHYYSESFATIAGCDANSAIIHYQPQPDTNRKLNTDSLLLLDSGAHYFDGTTDITRTFVFATAKPEIKAAYTQVLKAHIALSRQRFPAGTSGAQLDAVARSRLWMYDKDYAHGTGHGVGHCLNVHEGPQSISLKNPIALKSGMICSIEPGYYQAGAFGIRIENLAVVRQAFPERDDSPLYFDTLTLVPYERKLIAPILLDKDEITWVNDYHQKVYTALAPLLKPEVAAWLKEITLPL